jgi:hypothetical protein
VRVISRFSDYYDGLRVLDEDPEPLYLRETREVRYAEELARAAARDRSLDPLWTERTTPPHSPIEDMERFVVGFCGQVHSGYRWGGRVFWELEPLIEAARAKLPRREVARLLDPQRPRSGHLSPSRELTRGTWDFFVEHRPAQISDAPFLALRAPVVVLTDDRYLVNPQLSAWGFAARVDPYTCWQELSMFLGNNLAVGSEPAPRPIDDTLRAHTHGFDKQSFRNTKNRPKGNRSDW